MTYLNTMISKNVELETYVRMRPWRLKERLPRINEDWCSHAIRSLCQEVNEMRPLME